MPEQGTIHDIQTLIGAIQDYNPSSDKNLLASAYKFADKAHDQQKRASGEPYITHPLAVAMILANLHMDDYTIVTALLHDTVEDTEVTIANISENFGEKIASLVDGVTKIAHLQTRLSPENWSDQHQQAENFHKMILATSHDIRVLLVKLADRLHNMRTLHYVTKQDKRQRKARETLELYVPLAGRIGVHALKEQLEDLAFQHLNPQLYSSINQYLRNLQEKYPHLLGQIEHEITKVLTDKTDLSLSVIGRIKSPYSISQKMQRQQHVNFDELPDILGVRVLVDNADCCYRAMGAVHQHWPCIFGRVKDYISVPKNNGYRALHTTLVMKYHKVEVQFRSHRMNLVAERGLAAHWSYKQGSPIDPAEYRWVTEMLQSFTHSGDEDKDLCDFLEYAKMDVYRDQIFCFTPKGHIIRLPAGATPIDFAYAVHSDIGHHCVSCRINGLRMPIRTVLQNGDSIEIICDERQWPPLSWESFVVTAKAKNSIRGVRKQKIRDQFLEVGKQILRYHFHQEHMEFSEDILLSGLTVLDVKTVIDLYLQVGQGKISGKKVLSALFPEMDFSDTKIQQEAGLIASIGQDHKRPLLISGLLPDVAIHMCRSCGPLPGEHILGVVLDDRGLEVHSAQCPLLEQYDEQAERLVELQWEDDNQQGDILYPVSVRVDLVNEPGVLGDMATLLGRNRANIANIITFERREDCFSFRVDLELRNLEHLHNVLNVLKASRTILQAYRLFEQNTKTEGVSGERIR